ncbi:hypothetical protein IFM89_026066 [Coptis chinensis]|uniref:F-box domain-containing protein n=1 Tax=Coptis chinensis TaxID=261450 RepID=A0A835M6K7_9MAGN|nr:hypothetical protein IFM89_026066 [Coptis chinensis]
MERKRKGQDVTWFDGVTWTDIFVGDGNNTEVNVTSCNTTEVTRTSSVEVCTCNKSISYETTNIVCGSKTVLGAKLRKGETEKIVGGNEFKVVLLLDFPTEIISDILSRLPVEDIGRCRTVCKSLDELSKEIGFIDLHLSKATTHPTDIVLQQTFSGPVNNLFLLSTANGGDDPVIYNPILRECLMLPKSDFTIQGMSVLMYASDLGIGYDSANKIYKVVRVYNILYDEPIGFCIKGEIITVGESSWRALDFPHKVTICNSKLRSVFSNGAFHWALDKKGHGSHLDQILVLDIVSEKFQTIKFPPSVKLPEFLDLLKFRESLALVEISSSQEVLWIWQIVGSRNTGGRVCQFTISLPCTFQHFRRRFRLLGVLSHDDLLFEALEIKDVVPSQEYHNHYSLYRSHEYHNHLALYSLDKKERFILEINGIPRSFCASFFVPSLVSP